MLGLSNYTDYIIRNTISIVMRIDSNIDFPFTLKMSFNKLFPK
jgi:hypothetical protein